MQLLTRAADVVEAAEHARDVADALVGQRPLRQRAQRFALEVEEHPPPLGGVEHLTQVVVAVDPLERGPVGLAGRTQHRLDRAPDLLELGCLHHGGVEAALHLRDDGRGLLPGRRLAPEDLGQRGVHLGRGLAEGPGRAGEVGARLRRPQGDAPGVLDARQELLREGQVTGCRRVALAARVRPAPRHRAHDRRNAARPRVSECALEDDVGVVTGGEHPEDLDDQRGLLPVREVAVDDDRGVGLLPGQHPRGAHVDHAAPGRLRDPRDALLHLVRPRRRLGAYPSLEQLEELGGVDRIVRRVVDPAQAEDRVLHRADQGVAGTAQRLTPVGEGHLVDDRLLTGLVGDDERLDPHLALGVVETPGGEEAQARPLTLRGIPALVAHPGLDQLELRRADRGGRDDVSHGGPRRRATARARRSPASRG